MNRRTFLKRLGIGATAAAVASVIPVAAVETVKGRLFPGWTVTVDEGPALTLEHIRNLKQQLVARNVQSHMGGYFTGVVHLNVIKDLTFERFTYRFQDGFKRTSDNDKISSSWTDYTNFSEFAHQAAIDDVVKNAATELANARAKELNAFMQLTGHSL